LSQATLAGHRVTDARVSIPAWGCWYADVSIDGEFPLSGRVELKVADLTLKGAVLSGGPEKGRSKFRLVAGAGGWGKPIEKRSYDTDAGVKLATVLRDAAGVVGETIDAATVPADTVGPGYARRADQASRVLELLVPGAWYVGEDGITRLGRRPAVPLKGAVTHGPVDRARGTVTLATDLIATILPGTVVDGLEAVDVEHVLSVKGGLRSTIWGANGLGKTSRRLAALRALLEQLDPFRRFRGVTEYRVVTQTGQRINLQPVRVSTGMPDLRRVPVRPGVSGCNSNVALGSRVLVGFVDSQPSRPYVAGFEDADGEGFVPLMTHIDATTLRLGNGVKPAIGAGDLAGGIWPCVPTQVKVLV